jgi:uncharacterized protein (DUF2235 family)
MSKNVAFFADGTWNHPGETQDGLPADTNVYKMFKMAPTSASQISQYDDGVGADGSAVDQLLGGAIGDGLFAKVKQGHAFIAHAYRPGDQIYIFGFSRGAYTTRSLAGMIAICGLPDPARLTDPAVDDAFDAYRTRTNRQPLLDALKEHYGNNQQNVEIAMVGVWDTVGALGIPGDLFEGLDTDLYGFLDTTLHPDVKAAYHALSIDERRAEFVPTLWTPNGSSTLEQVWFTGVHADVGGGYAESGLSDIALSWMVKKAKSKGLLFDAGAFAQTTSVEPKHALDAAHDSWTPLWGFPKSRTVPGDAVIANSVALRLANLPTYRPANVALTSAGVLAASYGSEPVV